MQFTVSCVSRMDLWCSLQSHGFLGESFTEIWFNGPLVQSPRCLGEYYKEIWFHGPSMQSPRCLGEYYKEIWFHGPLVQFTVSCVSRRILYGDLVQWTFGAVYSLMGLSENSYTEIWFNGPLVQFTVSRVSRRILYGDLVPWIRSKTFALLDYMVLCCVAPNVAHAPSTSYMEIMPSIWSLVLFKISKRRGISP